VCIIVLRVLLPLLLFLFACAEELARVCFDSRVVPPRAYSIQRAKKKVKSRRVYKSALPLVNFSASNNAARPTIAPRPFVSSAAGLNIANVSPGAVTPSGFDFLSTGARDAPKITTATNGAKNKPAPGYVTVSETPSANVNVLVENTCPHKDLPVVISLYNAAIHPICATLPLIISIAVALLNTLNASSNNCVSFPNGAASLIDPSAGSIMAFLGLGISFEAAGASSDFSKISASSMDDDGSTSAFKNACLAREGALTFLVEEEERVCELILAIDCVVKENIS